MMTLRHKSDVSLKKVLFTVHIILKLKAKLTVLPSFDSTNLALSAKLQFEIRQFSKI